MQHCDYRLIKKTNAGFSLLELSIVLLIISLIAGSGMVIGKSAMETTQRVGTNNRLDIIEKALMAYRLANNRLPCPADGVQTASSAVFGVEAANPGTCTNPNLFISTINGSRVVEGVVPVRTLGLPDEFAYDGWGMKIAYAVWAPMTAPQAFLNYGIQFNCGMITVKDPSGNTRSTQADYVVLSYGKNGHGAYNQSGKKNSSGSINPDELTNCHCDSSATDAGYLATYVMKEATDDATNSLNSFDDILRYKERWQLQNYVDQNNPSGLLTCPQFPPGFRVDGAAGDNVGSSVAVGDVNGDGIPDLIIGAPKANGGAGAVYVVFGTSKGFPDPLPLLSLIGTNGFIITGVAANDQTGFSVAAGDVNGDGIADIIIGAPGAGGGTGSAYVVYGSRGAWNLTFSLAPSNLTGTNGFRMDGTVSNGQAGSAVASGDINNDGYADIVIGAPGDGLPVDANGGHVYTVFGNNAAFFATAPKYTLDANINTGLITTTPLPAKGFQINTVNPVDMLGTAVAVGDVNGDGIADIVMGQPGSGTASVIFGKGTGSWSETIALTSLNGSNGFHIVGSNNAGTSLAVGDINGDGIGDIIIGVPGINAAYAVFGSATAKPKNIKLSNLSNGFHMDGAAGTGTSVAVGDVNGDGIGDIIIGAPNANPGGLTNAGSTYVLFGSKTPPGSPFTLSTGLVGTNGFELDGASRNDQSGGAVAAGDVNGDNKFDVIIGASGATYAVGSGSTYVYFGQKKPNTWPNSWVWPTGSVPYNPYNLSGL